MPEIRVILNGRTGHCTIFFIFIVEKPKINIVFLIHGITTLSWWELTLYMVFFHADRICNFGVYCGMKAMLLCCYEFFTIMLMLCLVSPHSSTSLLFSGGVWPICIKQHGRISKITILLKRHFSLCTRMLCSSYQSKINTVNTKTRITRITMIWNVYKLTIMTSPPFKGKFIKHAMWTNFNSGICLQSPMVNLSIEHHLKFSLN